MADEGTDPALGPSVRRVQDVLAAAGGGHTVVALQQPARTSAEAARAVGCRVDQIAKSLVFRGENTQSAVLVITSGVNRVDERRVAGLVAEPVAHAEPLTILSDEDLMQWPEIWAAAGHPNTVFKLTPADLVQMTGGRVASVKSRDGR